MERFPLIVSLQTHGGCTKFMATYVNGVPTCGVINWASQQPTKARPIQPGLPNAEQFVGGHGRSMLLCCALRAVGAERELCENPISVSGWSGNCPTTIFGALRQRHLLCGNSGQQ